MKKAILGTTLFLGITSMAVVAQDSAELTDATAINCSDFTSPIVSAINEQVNLNEVLTTYLTSCSSVADQIIEVAINNSQPEQHQAIMQAAADTNLMQPADILLAAIAGGGDPATLSEPTAAGNSAIVPASAATAPPVIGGRNGGTGDSTNAASAN
ncbi:hypothetical protein [Thalassotalea euphylliae]|uniref:Uncharacterized protein n=1 Tax=Thalassotalea euphylliae TaxID=1655234 RepID=A0A3E0UHU1_9GAMM|nr:hypothetical protein [Thalassotalea euphylliae]REL36568.1 hypothetical protein DXX92_15290 [Thalassotalea euphylliae]